MTVQEMIAELQKLDENHPVVVPGHEGGANDAMVTLIRIRRDVYADDPCLGDHQVVSAFDFSEGTEWAVLVRSEGP